MIALLLLNSIGYYGLLVGLQFKYDTQMKQKFDADNYEDSEFVTIKIPISVPYAPDSRGFERVDGKFEHQGEFYRMVKQKLSRDTIYLVCVKDDQSKRINQAFISYVKTFTDKTANSQSQTKLFNTLIKDYLINSFAVMPLTPGWECDVVKDTSFTFFTSDFYPSIVHPPERG